MHKCLQFIGCLFLCVATLSSVAQSGHDKILEQKLTVEATGETLDEVLAQISEQAGINFSYDPSLLDTDWEVRASFINRSLSEVLNQLLGSEFAFYVLDNQLIIRLREEDEEAPVEIEKYRILRGILIDAELKVPIPYASISVLNRNFGTITNRDGVFELKIPPKYQHEQLVFSCMGYAQRVINPDGLTSDDIRLSLEPVDIRLSEIKVRAIRPMEVLGNMLERMQENYPDESRLLTAFYREVLSQDGVYKNVSEAIIQMLKAPYLFDLRQDRTRFLKGRKSPDLEAFQWVDFKMQGGPYYITLLDIIKNKPSFLDDEHRIYYEFQSEGMIDYLGRPTYILSFSTDVKSDFLTYEGKLFIDQESYALVHSEFSLSRNGIRLAKEQLIRKKPKGFSVRALNLDYQVSYQLNEGRWYLSTAQSSVSFRVRSRMDEVNSVFHSVSDLLVTKDEPTRLRKFPKEELVLSSDIFTEMITNYDSEFWGNYNIIHPTDDLTKAIKSITQK